MVDGPAKTPRQCSTMKCALSRSIDNSASGVNCFEKQITLNPFDSPKLSYGYMNSLVLRWKIFRITNSAKSLVQALGVRCSIFWFGAYYISARHLVIVLKVPSDQERDMLRANIELTSRLRALLLEHKWPFPESESVIFDIESQETVGRETNGNWFYHYK